MNQNNEALTQIAKTIKMAVEHGIENAHFDKSYTARVTAKLANNRYIVEYNGRQLNVKGHPSAEYNIGDYVTITIPQNNISNTFIIPKTGSYRDPGDVRALHTHGNKTVLDRLTNKNVDDMNILKEMAFKGVVSESDLDEPLAEKVNRTIDPAILDMKVDKEAGKGLSTNDFTDEYKKKVDDYTESYISPVQSDWAEVSTSSLAFIKNKPNIPHSIDDLTGTELLMRTDKLYIAHGGNAASLI